MSAAARLVDNLVLLFWLVHIPVTIFVDSQAVLPAHWYPRWATSLNASYIQKLGDPLVSARPPWFLLLMYVEVFAQLPVFILGTYAFATRKEWIRTPALVYSISTAATMVPILGELVLTPAKAGYNRSAVIACYLPFLVVPLVLTVRLLTAGPVLFPRPSRPRYKNR